VQTAAGCDPRVGMLDGSNGGRASPTASSPDGEQGRLMRMLPSGYSPGVCAPVDAPKDALASVVCKRNTDSRGPGGRELHPPSRKSSLGSRFGQLSTRLENCHLPWKHPVTRTLAAKRHTQPRGRHARMQLPRRTRHRHLDHRGRPPSEPGPRRSSRTNNPGRPLQMVVSSLMTLTSLAHSAR
jgi:hypothetical protein